jgi:pimeloyl-ACP methyl ester carboxylesterase
LILVSFPQAGDEAPSSWALSFADAIERRGLDAAGSEFVWGGARFDADAAKWIRQGFMEHRPQALAATLRRVLAPLPPIKKMEDQLSAFRVPTLIVVGELDAPALASSRELAQLIPGTSLIVVPGGGHVVNLQKPELFNGAIGNFLRRI